MTIKPMRQDRFIYYCFHCRKTVDAFQAPWCNCITGDTTFHCPRCNECFCDASSAYKREFWAHAPKRLHQMRRARLDASHGLAALPPIGASDLKRPLVLIVDDSKVIRTVASRAIQEMGYGAIVAADAQQALSFVELYRPEMIITDALMPKMDGREFCRRIKASEDTADTIVVIMTGLYTAAHYKFEAYRMFYADEYLHKPIDPGMLKEIVQRFLGKPEAISEDADFQFAHAM
jgi:CheY-like chemotaxis protein